MDVATTTLLNATQPDAACQNIIVDFPKLENQVPQVARCRQLLACILVFNTKIPVQKLKPSIVLLAWMNMFKSMPVMSRDTEQVKPKFLVVDDHEAILEGTIPALKGKYPEAEILTAQDAQTALSQVERYHPDLAIVDLCLPEKPHATANAEVGIQLLRTLMESALAPNLVVLSTNVKPLVRLKPMINAYEGGFAAMDKSLPIKEMLRLIDMALRGSIYLSTELRSRPEFDRRWIEVLTLKFQEGLTDKAIAEKMKVSDRTVRNYWIRLQDALGVYDEPGKELRVQIEIAARKIGLIS